MMTFSIGINWVYHTVNAYDEMYRRYIGPYYSDFKSEIMEYEHIANIKQVYESEIHPKALAFHQTELAKSMVYHDDRKKQDKVIPLEHLIRIILYTDYTKLSRNFSSSFRANNKYEPFESIKQRHKKYFWFAKGLQEMMTLYGQNYEKGKGLCDPLQGPFYCGMNFVMNLNQFNIRLNGPTSTSMQISVATRFGGDKGFLIRFENSTGSAQIVNGFDVSWISRYGFQEDERYIKYFSSLFIYHQYPLSII